MENVMIEQDKNMDEVLDKLYADVFPVATLFGKKVLVDFSQELMQLKKEQSLPSGSHYFGIRHSDYDTEDPRTVEDKVVVNRYASILAKEDLLTGNRDLDDIYKEINEGDFVFDETDESDDGFVNMSINDFMRSEQEEFLVDIEEVHSVTVPIKATSKEEALKIAEDLYRLKHINMGDAQISAVMGRASTSDYGDTTDYVDLENI